MTEVVNSYSKLGRSTHIFTHRLASINAFKKNIWIMKNGGEAMKKQWLSGTAVMKVIWQYLLKSEVL